MKLLFFIKCTIFIVCITTTLSCKKTDTSTCFKVKYIDGICATNVYQIQDPNFYHLGQNNWVCPRDGRTYDNVFVLKNNCVWQLVGADSTGMVTTTNEGVQNCITCLAVYINPPTKQLAVKRCE